MINIINDSQQFQEAVAKLKLPPYLEIVIEPWPYGTPSDPTETGRYFQGVIYARDKRQGDNVDSNFYPFPVPIIPVVDIQQQRLTKVLLLPTGGKGDPLRQVSNMLDPATVLDLPPAPVLGHNVPSEYVPELLTQDVRKDLKELNVSQPDGPSFSVSDDSLVEWQKWRFRVGFTPREGVVIHDVRYDNRSLFYRLSISEMVFPPTSPNQMARKQSISVRTQGIR